MRPIFVNRPMGPLMVGVVVLVSLMLIYSTVALQDWKDVIRRDDEAEMIFRAREIVRGLRRYQQDRGALPTDLELLKEPGSKGQYFIRRLYDDPLVTDGKWGLLLSGSASDNKQGSDNFEPEYDDGDLEENQLRDYTIGRERYGVTADLDYRASDRSNYYLRGLWTNYLDDELRRA